MPNSWLTSNIPYYIHYNSSNMVEIYKAISQIIENPFAKMAYIEFKKALETMERIEEAKAIELLIQQKFN